jgi:endonuclease YncB( thermonuclease family)
MRITAGVGLLLLAVLAFFAFRGVGQVSDVDDEDGELLVLAGTVERIVDGDTVDVVLDSGKVRVRMQGIDAPERDQPLSEEAVALLRQLIGSDEVELQVAEQTSYDRMVARVFAAGTDANAEMVKRGLAMAERRFLDEFDGGESYCVFEHSARLKKAGIWGLPADQRIAPWEWRRRANRPSFTDYGTETVAGCVAAIGKPLTESEPATGDGQRDQREQLPSFTCGTKRTCSAMTSCAEATFYYQMCGVSSLDGNDDGTPCNDICR